MILHHEQVREFFRAHSSVRKYKEFVLPQEHLDTILYAAQRAPTDATAQLYSIIRLSNGDLKTKVAALSANPHMAAASETFIVVVMFTDFKKFYKLRAICRQPFLKCRCTSQ